MPCDRCPCPERCPSSPAFCGWAAEDPPSPVRLQHIRVVSGCAESAALDFRRPGPPARPAAIAKELVVCRYREDMSWLDRVPSDFHVTAYLKSDEPVQASRPMAFERLPNVGREAHSMLWHIVRHYDSLAEWTYFAQGDAPSHAPDFLGRLAVDYPRLSSLSRTYSPTHPPEATHAFDLVDHVGGYEVRYGDAEAPCEAIPTADGRPFWHPAVWPRVFACPRPERIFFGYAAMFAVPRDSIARRPRWLWEWLLDEVTRARSDVDTWADPPLTPWKMESLWLYLFSDPALYPHREDRRPPTAAEAVELTRRMAGCPHRSTEGCGCGGGRCALRGGEPVSYLECFPCLRESDRVA